MKCWNDKLILVTVNVGALTVVTGWCIGLSYPCVEVGLEYTMYFGDSNRRLLECRLHCERGALEEKAAPELGKDMAQGIDDNVTLVERLERQYGAPGSPILSEGKGGFPFSMSDGVTTIESLHMFEKK